MFIGKIELSKGATSVEEKVVDSFGELKIGEYKFRDYECPEIILSKKEEQRISGSWKKDYREDVAEKNKSPSFYLASDAIEQVVVWVCVLGLPIDYYGERFISLIGKHIWYSVKVDRNTLNRERGKYARLWVQVELTKPLLAIFSIKGRHYKVEYEGVHIICLNCGSFGVQEALHPKEEDSGMGVIEETPDQGHGLGTKLLFVFTVVINFNILECNFLPPKSLIYL
ncbi:hypothetical protein KIW84_055533 [Lathyrus oleraceus]|uniref:DUF4283 domain-containing protein n=1 Tax=Pisum sativum TaxID=3888 RepID=A0A9D4X0R7_PEA|nr:hypothetical protein KIW84_055533 [Pisum sativum]